MTTAPTHILIFPNGHAEWGVDVVAAEKALGPHGVGRAFLTDGSRLRVAMSDCALLLTEEYLPNPYAAATLARVAGLRPEDAPETRGPVILFGWDGMNEWDNSRPFTDVERIRITEALAAADVSVS